MHGKLGSLAALSEMQLNRIDMQSPARQSTHTHTHTCRILNALCRGARARRTSTPAARPSPSAVFTDVGTELGLKALKRFQLADSKRGRTLQEKQPKPKLTPKRYVKIAIDSETIAIYN